MFFRTLALLIISVTPAVADESGQLREALQREWDHTMQEAPLWASELGDRRWNDRWSDESIAAEDRRAAHNSAWLSELNGFDRAALPPQEQINLDLAKYDAERDAEGHVFRLWLAPLNQLGGMQTIDQVADSLRFETLKDYEDWLARLHSLPAHVEQNIALMRQGIAEKRTLPKVILRAVPAQIQRQIADKPQESPLFKPYRKFGAKIAEADRQRLATAAAEVIAMEVVPAYRKLLDFFEHEYLPASTEDVGLWQWPDGAEAYAYCARRSTTTDLPPRELHELGRREVARIETEMQAIQAKVGFAGTRAQFYEHLRTDPQFFYHTPEELLAAYRATAKRIDPLLVRLFKTLPRAPYGVEPVPEGVAASSPAAYYREPASDGSRAGTFFANLYLPAIRPKREITVLCLHEAVPGHHLQIARAQELSALPEFRRHGSYTAYTEGWGLYAESLGDELGLYEDPYSKFGQLSFEMWRACRLVVDTGMHALRWKREQAIDYLTTHTAKSPDEAAVEIDRYIAWPGQALAYKVGELKLKALRAEATQALGPKWDVREFHEVVLGSGSVPLEVLEKNVRDWVTATLAGR